LHLDFCPLEVAEITYNIAKLELCMIRIDISLRKHDVDDVFTAFVRRRVPAGFTGYFNPILVGVLDVR